MTEELYFQKYFLYAKELSIGNLKVFLVDTLSQKETLNENRIKIGEFIIVNGKYNDDFYINLDVEIIFNAEEYNFYSKNKLFFIQNSFL